MLQVISEAVQADEPTMINLDYAVGRIKEYYSESQKSGNGRYLSWEHCYSNFGKYRGIGIDEETIDFLCLHLAFYLASWGMYRGSSFLLQRDYRIHREVVVEILKQEYLSLWGISCESLLDPQNLDLIFNLRNKIEKIYIDKRASIDGRMSVSDILITKILLGT